MTERGDESKPPRPTNGRLTAHRLTGIEDDVRWLKKHFGQLQQQLTDIQIHLARHDDLRERVVKLEKQVDSERLANARSAWVPVVITAVGTSLLAGLVGLIVYMLR